MKSMRRQRGFTIIELLIVIAIISMLSSILVPSLSRAKAVARRVACLSNIRNMVIAANHYATVHDGTFPISQYCPSDVTKYTYVAWDYRYRADGKLDPGLLWSEGQDLAVLQCPSYDGPANWFGDKYTGYNYNTSYTGHGQGEAIAAPARIIDVKDPTNCALFGDGENSAGANKFMRSPFTATGDRLFTQRCAGTQGFRHIGTTNVGFCDGHVATLAERYSETSDPAKDFTDTTGFLSPDNSLYDLE